MSLSMSKRLYLAIGLVALVAIALGAVTLTSRLTAAQGSASTPVAQTCDQQDAPDTAAEGASNAPETDNIEQACGPQDKTAGPCNQQDAPDTAAKSASTAPDTDNIEQEC